MHSRQILDELVSLLEQNGIAVRAEPTGGGGAGLCILRDKAIVFIDSSASAAEMAVVCAQAIAKTIDVENVYLKPQIRDFLEKHCDQSD